MENPFYSKRGGVIESRFFSACLTEAPRQGSQSSHTYPGKTSLPLPTPESGEGRRAWRWTKDGRRQGAKHSGFEVSAPFLRAVHHPQGKMTSLQAGNPACSEKEAHPTHLVPAQLLALQTVVEVGSLQRLPFLSHMGTTVLIPVRCDTTRKPYHLFPTSAAIQLYAFGGWALSSGQGRPAARLPLFSGSLDMVQLECGSPILPGQAALNWDSLPRLQ